MAKPDSWMPYYGDDFQSDTAHCSAAERGAYLDLLWACWKRGNHLPTAPDQIMRLARCTLAEWKSVRETVMAFFVQVTDGWQHKRVGKERAKAAAIYTAKAEAGAKGAAKRWHTPKQTDGTAIAEPLANGCTTHNSHSPGGETVANATVSARAPKPTKGTPLANDWKCDEAGYRYGEGLGLTRPETDAESAEFRDYFHGADAREPIKRDWARAFQRWLRQNARRRLAERSRGNGRTQNGSSRGSVVDTVARLKAAADLAGQNHGSGMGRGLDGIHAAGDDAGATIAGDDGGSAVIEAAESERLYRASRGAETSDGSATGAGARHGSPAALVREETGGIPRGRGPESFNDATELLEVVADVGGIERPAGPVCKQAQAASGSDDGLDIPDFLRRYA